MSKVKFKLNGAGVRELLKSQEMGAICMDYALKIQETANGSCPGYVAEARHYPERTGAAVYPGTYAAERDNYKNNTLLKARGG